MHTIRRAIDIIEIITKSESSSVSGNETKQVGARTASGDANGGGGGGGGGGTRIRRVSALENGALPARPRRRADTSQKLDLQSWRDARKARRSDNNALATHVEKKIQKKKKKLLLFIFIF